MSSSIFNPNHPQDISSKIVASLERISEVFKALLWEKAKQIGLSPIQIQLLIFIAYHKVNLCNVSKLAKEFNLTKPTVSDAVKVLERKGLIVKDHSSTDNRSYSIHLSAKGEKIVSETNNFANPVQKQLLQIPPNNLETVYSTLTQLIYKLNQSGILSVQRTCFGCKFYSNKNDTHYCNLLEQKLRTSDIKLDCPEFEEKN